MNTDDENTLKVVTWCQAGGVVEALKEMEGVIEGIVSSRMSA
jgi:hypothetical protein